MATGPKIRYISSWSSKNHHEDAKEKKSTMDSYWVPGVNHLGTYGRWAFAEFTELYQIEADFKAKVEREFEKEMIEYEPQHHGLSGTYEHGQKMYIQDYRGS